ncbi:DUF1697 domain-containing protein [Longispora sp. K20-0274]|uniref:DUF1697 domain-containing protein n=1 Tax=Longispora sp. K20-0274 TaxID=3088255 RepID=UPI00399ADC99
MRRILLLRAVNVGGANKLPMAWLKAALTELGCTEVTTLLQSGNAVVSGGDVAGALEKHITTELGLTVRVLTRTRDELADVIARCPWPDRVADPKSVHVDFLSAAPTAAKVATLDPAPLAPDEFVVDGAEAFLWYANGSGRSKLTNDLLERRLGVTGTARNWNTVTKLLTLADA